MRAHFRLISRFAFTLAIVALALSSGAPTMAAGAFQVDDDKVECPHAAYDTLQAAVDAAALLPAATTKTITVCAGTYTGATTIDGLSNLELIGKKGAVLASPPSFSGKFLWVENSTKVSVKGLALLAGPSFSGRMIAVDTSTRVTLQRLTIDGQSNLAGGELAVYYLHSSGTVAGNRILNWYGAAAGGQGIYFNGTFGVFAETARVTGNTITDFVGTGIDVESLASAVVTGNRVAALPSAYSADGISAAYNLGGRITGNRLTGPSTGGLGMGLYEMSNFKLSGNRLTHWDTGIEFQGFPAGFTFDNNTLSGNRLLEVGVGIHGMVLASPGDDGHADNLKITGNKFKDTLGMGTNAILIEMVENLPKRAFLLDAMIKGNSITHFTTALTPNAALPPYITGAFGPNSIHP